jgi:hypothetical protein
MSEKCGSQCRKPDGSTDGRRSASTISPVALRASFGRRKVRLAGRATVILPADQSVLTPIIDSRKWQESRSHCTLSGFQLGHLDYVAALVDHAARQVVEQPIT